MDALFLVGRFLFGLLFVSGGLAGHLAGYSQLTGYAAIGDRAPVRPVAPRARGLRGGLERVERMAGRAVLDRAVALVAAAVARAVPRLGAVVPADGAPEVLALG